MLVTMTVALLLGSGLALAQHITGTAGDNEIKGTRNVDQMYGLGGDDDLFGRDGDDELYGGSGRDLLVGGPGDDEIYGGSGSDDLLGGPGNDYINSADNNRQDVVDCGDGNNDRVVFDGGTDTVIGCEDESPN